MAVTLAVNMGSKDAIDKSTINTSNVKTRPAIGALNMPAIAAAAPHPTRSIKVLLSNLNNCPKFEPIAEPVKTIGASAPTDPPKPIVMADAITEDQQLCTLRRDRFEEIAYNIRVMPCEMLSLTMYLTNKDVRYIPITGNTRYNQFAEFCANPSVSIYWICLMSQWRNKAATEANSPIKKANIRVNCLSLI